ncbi:UDP-glucose dehydrogenase [Leucobacter sp. 7(1)]|uniref:UDP-glucose dehydrogenase family protein n=1 Tax=Leucobacter sp. 7(1) TaxID=1255613 RepID=UPI00097F1F84|nr:UDP-glucose/GDP-mannose dehydrogenase family protein [Leucobacter sp. 7(1)]SJN11874.1 UDP-glucose dehydrogenase [Leucobacter sp. 7(1)]
MNISVIGCGYLGAVHAATLAHLGHTVVGIDTEPRRIAALRAGTAPFFEPELDTLLRAGLANGRLTFSTDPAAVAAASVHFICVGTPAGPDGASAELRYVRSAIAALRPHLSAASLVVGKSTVPVGTAADLSAALAGTGAVLAWNPEFLREGHAVADSLTPDRILVGCGDENRAHVESTLREVYRTPLASGSPLVLTDLPTAELAKGAANAFLATKVSFMNMLADVADAAGADVTQLATVLGLDPRIGARYLGSGIGFGGGCLPKDLRAFVARAEELGQADSAQLLGAVERINAARPDRFVTAAERALGGALGGARIAVLGAAFKPDSDDVRDSPALVLAAGLQARGADVIVTDPAAVANAQRKVPELCFASDTETALRGADLIVVGTEWSEYRALDPRRVSKLVRNPVVLDGRNCLDRAQWIAAGWQYHGVGRTPTPG